MNLKSNRFTLVALCIISILCTTFIFNDVENLNLKDAHVTPYWRRFFSKNIKVYCEGEITETGEDFRLPTLSVYENKKIIHYIPRTNHEGWCPEMLTSWVDVINTSVEVYISGFYLGSEVDTKTGLEAYYIEIDKIRTDKAKWSYFIEEGPEKVGLRESQS